MIVLDPRNLILEKAFFNCCNGIVKNSPYNIRNRNGITKVSAYCSIMSACPNKRPKQIANSMIKVCSLSNVPIKNSPYTYKGRYVQLTFLHIIIIQSINFCLYFALKLLDNLA